MTIRSTVSALCTLALSVALFPVPTAHAGPTVIRDVRVQDLGVTPFPGRGYSLSTNTFQSTCLDYVDLTEPTYDYTYQFVEVDKTNAKSKSVSISASYDQSSLWVKTQVEANVEASKTRSMTSHQIMVVLDLYSYYSSVKEANSPLAQSGVSLLESGDVAGFFHACGPYYVRGITRTARYAAILAYETKDTTRHVDFEASIEREQRGAVKSSGSVSSSFSAEASSKHLVISARGWGLSKDEDASLVSTDIDSFKSAITEAFLSMQKPETGRIQSVEVVPWVENLEFQSRLPLETGNAEVADGNVVLELPLYQKKELLTQNGEFLAEVERAGRNHINNYYKAKLCRDTIDQTWMEAGSTTLMSDAAESFLLNNRTGDSDKRTLSELYSTLADSNIQALRDQYTNFRNQAAPCINNLTADTNMWTQIYDDIDGCGGLVTSLGGVGSQDVEDYCMPTLVE